LRNAAWSRTPLGAVASGWKARRVDAFATVPEPDALAGTSAEHTPRYLNYWLRCPAAIMAGFEIHHHDNRVGYFVLSRVAGQTRIAGLQLRTSSQDDWQQAFRLAAYAAADDTSTSEIVCLASTAVARAAITACGFRQRGTSPLFLCDPGGKLADAPPVAWQAIDDDTAYVHDPAHPYQT
jgi:hypothetical protein